MEHFVSLLFSNMHTEASRCPATALCTSICLNSFESRKHAIIKLALFSSAHLACAATNGVLAADGRTMSVEA